MIKENVPLTISNLRKLNKHIIDNFVKHESGQPTLEKDKDIYWVDGYLCALVSSPEPIISMDDWLPSINGDCNFKSEEHLTDIMSIILSLKNDIAKRFNNKSFKPLYETHNIESQLKQDLIIRWCQGYMCATFLFHGWVLKSKDNLDITKVLFPIILGTGTYDDYKLDENHSKNEEVFLAIPHAVEVFYEFSSDIINMPLPESDEDILEPIVNDNKIGRNEPCLCGSGKKYKKCCLSNDRTIH